MPTKKAIQAHLRKVDVNVKDFERYMDDEASDLELDLDEVTDSSEASEETLDENDPPTQPPTVEEEAPPTTPADTHPASPPDAPPSTSTLPFESQLQEQLHEAKARVVQRVDAFLLRVLDERLAHLEKTLV